MADDPLRRRLRRLGGLDHLTDGQAEAILDPTTSKTVNEPIAWTPGHGSQDRPTEWRCSVQVFNSLNEPLTVVARVAVAVPWRPHLVLLWGNRAFGTEPTNLRRLDVLDDHDNPGGEQWRDQTHKHLWSAAEGNDVAYTPTDIPATEPVGRPPYGDIFEAFCAEVGIVFGPDYKWEDPPEGVPASATLWEVP